MYMIVYKNQKEQLNENYSWINKSASNHINNFENSYKLQLKISTNV